MHSIRRNRSQFALALLATALCTVAQAAWDITTVGYPGATMTAIGGLNNAGQAAGSASFAADQRNVSFVYDIKRQAFTDLPQAPGYVNGTSAFAINEPGLVVGSVGTMASPDTNLGFILDKKGAFTILAHPDYTSTTARAVSATGLVTGFADIDRDPNRWVGFIYDPARGTYTDITFPGGWRVFAQGINGRGQIVGDVRFAPGAVYPGSPGGPYGYLRNRDGSAALFRVNGRPTRARGINDAGFVTGFVTGTDGVNRGWVAKPSSAAGYQPLAIPEAELIVVPGAATTIGQAIDNSGRVVGFYSKVDETGEAIEEKGFVATPVK